MEQQTAVTTTTTTVLSLQNSQETLDHSNSGSVAGIQIPNTASAPTLLSPTSGVGSSFTDSVSKKNDQCSTPKSASDITNPGKILSKNFNGTSKCKIKLHNFIRNKLTYLKFVML